MDVFFFVWNKRIKKRKRQEGKPKKKFAGQLEQRPWAPVQAAGWLFFRTGNLSKYQIQTKGRSFPIKQGLCRVLWRERMKPQHMLTNDFSALQVEALVISYAFKPHRKHTPHTYIQWHITYRTHTHTHLHFSSLNTVLCLLCRRRGRWRRSRWGRPGGRIWIWVWDCSWRRRRRGRRGRWRGWRGGTRVAGSRVQLSCHQL